MVASAIRVLPGIIIIITVLANTYAAEESFPFSVNLLLPNLPPGDAVTLAWRIDAALARIDFELRLLLTSVSMSNGEGVYEWFLFGFSDDGDFANSDICLIVKAANRSAYHATDATITNDGDAEKGASDAWIFQNGGSSSALVFKLSRAIDPGDAKGYVIDNATTNVVFVIGRDRALINVNLPTTLKVLQPVRLLRPTASEDNDLLDDASWIMDIIVHDVHVPAQETTYWCQVSKLPNLSKAVHIIGAGNEDLVHHMEVYLCHQLGGQDAAAHGSGEMLKTVAFNGQCNPEQLPMGVSSCRRVLGAWAMGAGRFVFPADVGTKIGGQGFYPYVMTEVHYNNPKIRTGAIDSSGIRFYVTSKLRDYDAGILEVGIIYNDNMAIPPGQHSFPLTGYCTPQCTEAALPNEGIWIYASQLHSHLTGRRMFTKRFRHGKELPEVSRDDHYSPHYQEIRKLPEVIRVLPGDTLATTCIYNTRRRHNVTMSGLAISDEMCVNYLHYYPNVDLNVCKSAASKPSMRRYFADVRPRKRCNFTTMYKTTNWTEVINVVKLKNAYANASLEVQCLSGDGRSFLKDTTNSEIQQPALIESARLSTRLCTSSTKF